MAWTRQKEEDEKAAWTPVEAVGSFWEGVAVVAGCLSDAAS